MSIQDKLNDLTDAIDQALDSKLYKEKDTLVNARAKFIDLGVRSGAVPLDYQSATEIAFTANNNYSLNFTNTPTAGSTASIILSIRNGGAYTIDWGTAKFAGGTQPSLTASGVDRLMVLWDAANNVPNIFVLGLDVK